MSAEPFQKRPLRPVALNVLQAAWLFLYGVGVLGVGVLVVGVLVVGALTACSEGPLGGVCADESECDYGLRCFKAGDFADGICTVRCDGGCADGLCVPSEHGDLCGTPCNEPGQCPDGQACQTAAGMDGAVCWPLDANLMPIPGELPPNGPVSGPPSPEIAGHLIENDTNDDQLLSAGEFAVIHVFVRNDGADPLRGLWAAADVTNVPVEINMCEGPRGSICSDRTSEACSCQTNQFSETVDLDGGEILDDQQVISLTVEVNPEASGTLEIPMTFGDEAGDTWNRTLLIPITDSGARVVFERVEVVLEWNDDEAINPGENVTVEFYARNTGVKDALGVWGAFDVPEGFAIRTCSANGSSVCSDRTAESCNCQQNQVNATQDIEPGAVANGPIIKASLELEKTLTPGSYQFPFTFGDRLGNTWQETVSIELLATAADMTVDSVELEGGGAPILVRGEQRTLAIHVRNQGTTSATGLWAAVEAPSASFAIRSCDVRSSFCVDRSLEACSCELNQLSQYLEVAPGELSNGPILEVSVDVDAQAPGSASFPVTIGDELGNTWTDSFEVTVQ